MLRCHTPSVSSTVADLVELVSELHHAVGYPAFVLVEVLIVRHPVEG